MIPAASAEWNIKSDVPLAVSNAVPATISRVAYCVRLNDQWVWTSFDWTDTAKLGVPADYQINGDVSHMNVFSNSAAIATTKDTTGRAEFWHNCYGSNYKDADTPTVSEDCYGSMQIHTKVGSPGQTLFGFNGWSNANHCDVTIGNDAVHQDGTFNYKCNGFNADGKSAIYTYVM